MRMTLYGSGVSDSVNSRADGEEFSHDLKYQVSLAFGPFLIATLIRRC